MYLLEVVWGAIDWIRLTPGRDTWRVFVNAIMHLRFPYNASLLVEDLQDSQEGLCFMELISCEIFIGKPTKYTEFLSHN
jgi:hypothetical protein